MKKKTAVRLLLLVMVSTVLHGCSPGSVFDKLTGRDGEASSQEMSAASDSQETVSERVYMDEISGFLTGFDGDTVRVSREDGSYDFDVSAATIECAQGILYNDEVSVIYEGRLTDHDTSSVRALKLADALHKKNVQEEYTLSGTLSGITSWSLTMTDGEGNELRLPIIGRPLYFSQGIQTEMPVIVHAIGGYEPTTDALGMNGASHVTVLTVSDQDPFTPPQADPAQEKKKEEKTGEATTEGVGKTDSTAKLRVYVEAFENNMLRIRSDRYDTEQTVELSEIPVSFPEGILPGTAADLYYTGTFNEKDLNGITITEIRGVPVSNLQTADVQTQVSGTVAGFTADTISLRTPDQTLFTCRVADVLNRATQPLLAGSQLKMILDPSKSAGNNIYRILRIEDA